LFYDVSGLLDDEPSKLNQALHGVPVLGDLGRLPQIVEAERIEEVIIASPAAVGARLRKLINDCKSAKVAYKILPGMNELLQGTVSVSDVRPVNYADLLNRQPVALNSDQIGAYLKNKNVMVTGGAGSIGAELCRQIAQYTPRLLVIIERNESGLYEHVLDLKIHFPGLNIAPVLMAVQNKERMAAVFRQYHPEVVFHAAAYKHVPMMEEHPWEAIFNNVVGSLAVLEMCRQFETPRCVMVSTDKAVRPTNIMGATKRLVERLTQCYADQGHTRFMAVRFGNVLGSIGSVMPLFRKQIAAGGPVTVTDPRITRYFMTIPEACGLILQSGALGKGGEIFILKMGTPVRILDMARDLITLSGFNPEEDMEIKFIGLRPGEKLYEELITQGEGIEPTRHADIMVLRSEDHIPLQTMLDQVDRLVAMAKASDEKGIRRFLSEIIPEYQPEPSGFPAGGETATDKVGVR